MKRKFLILPLLAMLIPGSAMADQSGEQAPHAENIQSPSLSFMPAHDMVDRLKTWEETRGLDGPALFRQLCAELDAAHDGIRAHSADPGALSSQAATAVRRLAGVFGRRPG